MSNRCPGNPHPSKDVSTLSVESDGPPSGSRRGTSLFRACSNSLALVIVTLAGGCADPAGTDASSDDSALFFDLLATMGHDYERAGTPAELAERSDLVVRGEITAVRDGRTYGPSATAAGALHTAVVEITVAEVEKGKANDGDRVHMELPRPTNIPFQDLAAASPQGARVLVFLTGFPSPVPGEPITNGGAGLPSGAKLYQPTTPQGLLIERRDGMAVAPLGDADLSDPFTLQEVVMDGRPWPVTSGTGSSPQPNDPNIISN